MSYVCFWSNIVGIKNIVTSFVQKVNFAKIVLTAKRYFDIIYGKMKTAKHKLDISKKIDQSKFYHYGIDIVKYERDKKVRKTSVIMTPAIT